MTSPRLASWGLLRRSRSKERKEKDSTSEKKSSNSNSTSDGKHGKHDKSSKEKEKGSPRRSPDGPEGSAGSRRAKKKKERAVYEHVGRIDVRPSDDDPADVSASHVIVVAVTDCTMIGVLVVEWSFLVPSLFKEYCTFQSEGGGALEPLPFTRIKEGANEGVSLFRSV